MEKTKINVIDFFSKQKNTLSKDINVYLCGPTVYDYAHIGNIRPIVVFDVFNRLVKAENKKLKLVHNFTDIDDKIINKSLAENKTEKEITTFYIDAYLNDLKTLNILTPDQMPKVTENIDGIISFVDELINKGFAYIKNGNVYFSIKSWDKYGAIYNLTMGDLFTNKSSEDSNKEYKHDFALWKKTNKGVKYNSPWSKGRPGWHTECSFFIQKYFGKSGIDIHGGGIDLKFPHHINEMAQYEALNNVRMSKNWLYVGHVNFENQKMSKSLKNVVLVNQFTKKYSANILRLMLISSHYTKPLDVSENLIQNSVNLITKINNQILTFIIEYLKQNDDFTFKPIKDKNFINIISNDLDIPNGITYLLLELKNLNKTKDIHAFNRIMFNLELLGFRLETNFNYRKLKEAILKNDYEYLDNFRKGAVI